MLKDYKGEDLRWGHREFCPCSSLALVRGRGRVFSWLSLESGNREVHSQFWLSRGA